MDKLDKFKNEIFQKQIIEGQKLFKNISNEAFKIIRDSWDNIFSDVRIHPISIKINKDVMNNLNNINLNNWWNYNKSLDESRVDYNLLKSLPKKCCKIDSDNKLKNEVIDIIEDLGIPSTSITKITIIK